MKNSEEKARLIDKRLRSNKILRCNSEIEKIIEKYQAAKLRGNYRDEELALAPMKKISMPYSILVKLEPLNILCYINYNGKVLERKNKKDAELLINRLMQADFNSTFVKEQIVAFISWASGYNYTDEGILVLVKKVCKFATFEDTNLLFDLQSALEAALCHKCSEYVQKTRNKIKHKESKTEKVLVQ